jgi:acetoin utilization deacetylase AcuC-like enzyme
MKVLVFYSSSYSIAGGFATVGKSSVVARLLHDEPIDGIDLREPRSATAADVAQVHDPDYVARVVSGERGQFTEHGPEFVVSVMASTGGVVAAVEAALSTRGCAGSLSSGLHHARHDRDSGYCTFNGLVIGARRAIDLGARRVLILDFDAHRGGGTASLIERLRHDGIIGIEQVDVSVSTFDHYPSSAWAVCRIADGRNYLRTIDEALDSVLDPSSIDLVMYNAGMDAHESAGGASGITESVIRERERKVFTWARSHDLPMAWVLAGGYPSSTFTIDDVARLHRITAEEAARAYG